MDVDPAWDPRQAMRRARYRRIFLPLRMMVDKMVDEGFLAERHKASLIFSGSVEDVLAGLQQFEMPEAKH